MNRFLEDVMAQPDSIRKALSFYKEQDYAREMKKLGGFDKVVFAGMGSSHHCNYGAAIHLAEHGVYAAVKSAGQLLQYDKNVMDDRCLLVLVSQSGESGEIVRLLEELPPETKIVAITNKAESNLGRRGGPTFLLHVDDEEAVSTRTYLSSWILVNMFARAVAGDYDRSFERNVETAMDALEALLQSADETSARLKSFFAHPSYVCYLGKGYSYSTVFGGALFTSELAKFPAMGFDSGEFRHGPLEMVDESHNAIIFAPQGPAYEGNCRMAREISEHGGKALLVTDRDPGIKADNFMTVGYKALPEAFSPLVDIAVPQLFANMIAESKNLDIGKFRWGSKVTTVV